VITLKVTCVPTLKRILINRAMASENDNVDPITGECIFSENAEKNDEELGQPTRGLGAIPETTVMEKFTLVTAVVSVGASITAIVVSGGAIVMTAGILAMGCGPYCYYQQTRITDIKALKETHRALEGEVNLLHLENLRLGDTVERLAGSVDRLADVENALDVISKVQGESVGEFETQVQDNKNILKSMEKNLKAAVLQNLLSVVMGSDTNDDFKLDEDEINGMIKRIKSINGVEVNESALRSIIAEKNGDIDSIVGVMQGVVNGPGVGKDEIFVFQD